MTQKKTTTIILIRHGQTDWNVERRWQGKTDVPLNATGRAQARALAARLTTWPIENIYSSDLSRAVDTAQVLADAVNVELMIEPGWRERDLGELEGLTREEIQDKFPHLALPRQFIEARGGETYILFKQRIVDTFKRIMDKHEGETSVVVSHSAALRVLVSHILELPDRIYAPFSLGGNTGISRIVIDHGRAQLNLLNDTSHIEG